MVVVVVDMCEKPVERYEEIPNCNWCGKDTPPAELAEHAGVCEGCANKSGDDLLADVM